MEVLDLKFTLSRSRMWMKTSLSFAVSPVGTYSGGNVRVDPVEEVASIVSVSLQL